MAALAALTPNSGRHLTPRSATQRDESARCAVEMASARQRAHELQEQHCCPVHCPVIIAAQSALREALQRDVNLTLPPALFASLEALLNPPHHCPTGAINCHALSMDYADAEDIPTVGRLL